MCQIVFFDIDGTLRDETYGVPESAERAVHELKEKGILVCLCTGRTKKTIPKDVMYLTDDCLIAGGGSYVEYRGEVLQDSHFPDEEVAEAYEQMKVLTDTAVVLEGKKDLYMNALAALKLRQDMEQKWKRLSPFERQQMSDMQNITYEDNFKSFLLTSDQISKICIWPSEQELIKVRNCRIWHSADMAQKVEIPGYLYYELVLKGCSKGSAVKLLCDRLGINPTQAIAFGDGMNDVDLLTTAGVGVAMQSGDRALFPFADSICEAPVGNGIYRELIRREII